MLQFVVIASPYQTNVDNEYFIFHISYVSQKQLDSRINKYISTPENGKNKPKDSIAIIQEKNQKSMQLKIAVEQ